MKTFSVEDTPWTGSGHDASILRQVFLTKGSAPGLTQFGRFQLEPGQQVEAHSHTDMWEIFFVVEGSVTFTVDGQPREVGSGEGLLMEPGDEHALTNGGQSRATVFIFGIEKASSD